MFSTQPEATQPMPPWPADRVERWPVERLRPYSTMTDRRRSTAEGMGWQRRLLLGRGEVRN